jgi:YVTN family beta-propeller protein
MSWLFAAPWRARTQVLRAKSFLRFGVPAFLAGLLGILAACGYTYRPIVDVVPKPGGDPQASHTALVVNSDGTTTQINISGETNSGNIVVGAGAVHAAFLQGTVFVANRDEDSVGFFSPAQVSAPVQHVNLPRGSRPVFVHSVETSTEGNCRESSPSNQACVYVACPGTNSVVVVSAGQALMQGNPILVGNNPVALAEKPNRTKVYAVNQNDASVSVILTATMQNVATITVGATPVWAAMNADGSRLYVVNRGSGTVSIIDTSSDTVLAELAVGASPVHAAFDSALRRLWVVNRDSNTVTVFDVDADANKLLATIPVGTAPAAIVPLPDGTRAYVANSASNNVSVIDSLSLKVTKTIPLNTGSAAANPVWIAASPDSSKVLVANHGASSVSSITTSNDQVVNSVATPASPLFITVSP